MPSCLILQHVAPERPYGIENVLTDRKVEQVVVRTFASDPIPSNLDDFDALVVMGGPMSATRDEGFPTRTLEVRLIQEALARELPMLGVCLGAQLLAAAAGGEVYPGGNGPEIGWAPVRLSTSASDDVLFANIPAELTVLHWHGDTYSLPKDASNLASSARYEQQAFRCGRRAWGLQFHVEVDEEAVRAFVASFGDEIATSDTSAAEILAQATAALSELGPHRDSMLGAFADLCVSAANGADAFVSHS